jgi:hypothetical protein
LTIVAQSAAADECPADVGDSLAQTKDHQAAEAGFFSTAAGNATTAHEAA